MYYFMRWNDYFYKNLYSNIWSIGSYSGVSISSQIRTEGVGKSVGIGCFNIQGTHVAADISTNNNAVFFFVSDLKIVYYNNY